MMRGRVVLQGEKERDGEGGGGLTLAVRTCMLRAFVSPCSCIPL